MKLFSWRLYVVLILLAVCLASPRPAHACATVAVPSGPDLSVKVADEGAVIIWDARTHTEHFIRDATFDTNATDFGFLVPTPTPPQLVEANPNALARLDMLIRPGQITRRHPLFVPFLLMDLFPTFQGAHPSTSGTPQLAATKGSSDISVISQQRIGQYDATVLKASDLAALSRWLSAHGYSTRPAVQQWLKPYIARGWSITAYKIVKDASSDNKAETSVVRMTFHTPQPFFPYSEPADQRLPGTVDPNRLLRVYLLSSGRMEGTLGQNGALWPGQTVWADALPDAQRSELLEELGLPAQALPPGLRLTVAEDHSSPRPGTEDVYFRTAADQSGLLPAPGIYVEQIPIPIELDIVIVMLWIAIRMARKKYFSQPQSDQKEVVVRPYTLRSAPTLLILGIFLVCMMGIPPLISLHNDDFSSQYLLDAVLSRDSATVNRLLSQGADPSIGAYRGLASERGTSLLAIAAANNDLPTMAALISHNQNVNMLREGIDYGEFRRNEFSHSSSLPDEAYTAYVMHTRETTPLMEAVLHDNLEAAKMLLQHGADINLKNSDDSTVLDFASADARPELTELLLRQGAADKFNSREGWSPLFSAIYGGRLENVRLLVTHRGDLNHTNFDGKTALDEAEDRGETQIAALLQAHGAKHSPPIPIIRPYATDNRNYMPQTPTGIMYAIAGYHQGAAFALPVPGTLHCSCPGPLWHSPTQILGIGGYPESFVLIDIFNGHETPLPKLTEAWSEPLDQDEIPWLRISSDGRWLLGFNQNVWQATDIMTGETYRWPKAPYPLGLNIDWLPNGKHWASQFDTSVLPMQQMAQKLAPPRKDQLSSFSSMQNQSTALYNFQTAEKITLPADLKSKMVATIFFNYAFFPTRSNGHLSWDELRQTRAYRGNQWSGQQMVAIHHGILANPKTQIFHSTTVKVFPELPRENFVACAMSPQGDHIAWISQTPGAYRFAVSQADGRHRRTVFITDSGWDIRPNSLGWTPDGRYLDFRCGEELFTVPVQN